MATRGTPLKRRARLVGQWRRSGETNASAFARRHGIHPRTFWGWCARVPVGPTSASARFVPVTIVDQGDRALPARVEIALASGDRICVHGGVLGDVIADAVRALRRSC